MSNFTLHDFQEEKRKEIHRLFETEKEVLLGMCTGSGKTVTTHFVIDDFLKTNPNSRVLVLAHGQTILRENFKKPGIVDFFEVKPGFNIEEAKMARAVLAIPQTISGKDLGKFDLLVVDEAHHFYNSKSVDKIKKGIKKRLLLTASHGKFNCKKLLFSTLEAYQMGMVTNCNIELVNAAWEFTYDDFNKKNNNLKAAAITNYNQTEETLKSLHEKLISLSLFNPKLNKIGSKLPSIGGLRKTMIIARDYKMSKQIDAFFSKLYPGMVLRSESKEDQGSENIEKFCNNNQYQILVVINRGTLGFDLSELQVVVDMSGSRSVDVIQQSLGRVLRKCDDLKKTFIKVMPTSMEYYTRAIMGCVVALMHPENNKKWNSKLKEIPILVKPKSKKVYTCEGKKKSNSKKLKLEEIVVDFMEYMDAFEQLSRKGDEVLSSYAFTNIDKVKNSVFGTKIGDPEGNKQVIWEWSRKYGKRPSKRRKDPEERRLGSLLSDYTGKSRRTYDPVFTESYNKEFPPRYNIERNKQAIWEWSNKHGERPSQCSKDPEERRLRSLLSTYTGKSQRAYDPVFTESYNKEFPPRYNSERNKQDIWEWSRKHGKRPSQHRKDPEERRLGMLLYSYTSKGSTVYCQIFVETYNKEFPPRQKWTKELCAEKAKLYNTRWDFQTKNVSAYSAAKRRKWLDEICKHMVCNSNDTRHIQSREKIFNHIIETKELPTYNGCKEEKNLYTSILRHKHKPDFVEYINQALEQVGLPLLTIEGEKK